MRSGNDRFVALRRTTDSLFQEGQQLISRGDYAGAAGKFKGALTAWRNGSGPRQEEARFVDFLGKCYVGQRKYEDAYALYSEALGYLTGAAYDEIYTSFLYLNERMGTFTKKDPNGF